MLPLEKTKIDIEAIASLQNCSDFTFAYPCVNCRKSSKVRDMKAPDSYQWCH